MQLRLLAHHQPLVEEEAGGVLLRPTQHVALALGVEAGRASVLSGSDRLEAEARRAQAELLARNRGTGGHVEAFGQRLFLLSLCPLVYTVRSGSPAGTGVIGTSGRCGRSQRAR